MSVLTTLAKAGGWFVGGQAASHYLGKWADESTDPFASLGLRAASMVATYKSFQGPLASITKGVAGGIRSNAIASARAGGTDVGSFAARGGRFSYVSGAANELPGWYLGSRSTSRTIGDWGLGGLGRRAGALGGMAASHAPGLMASPVTGAFEYAGAAYRSIGGGPGAFMAQVARMKSPEAPFVGAALVAGVYGSLQAAKYSHRGPVAGPTSMPYGWTSQPPVNPQNFGAGIAMGPSAIRSPTVMEGQFSVTNRMLSRHKV
jgi:hypothetical protein